MTILLDIIEVLLFLVCVLFSVAYLTVAERKTLGYFQRRLGPNAVGQLKQLKTYHIT
jgi:NADH-ubiquinone oxidoreductase chain 1